MQFDYQSQKAIIEEQEKFAEQEGEHHDAGAEIHTLGRESQVPPKQQAHQANPKKNALFSSNNNQ